MIRRLRNYVILLLVMIAGWFLQPKVDAFLQQRGWDQVLDRTIGSMPTWKLSPFWTGAFAVLAISGILELYYVWRRRRARRLIVIQAALLDGLNCAYVHFFPDTGEIVDSHNVTSLRDGGRGYFTITLAETLDARTLTIHAIAGSPMPTEWSPSPAGDSIQVKYKTEPESIRLRFDSSA
jgi:hypothetical protein